MTVMRLSELLSALAPKSDDDEYGPPHPLSPEAYAEQARHEAACDEHIMRKQILSEMIAALAKDVAAERTKWQDRMKELVPELVDHDARIDIETRSYRLRVEAGEAPRKRPEWVDMVLRQQDPQEGA